MSTNLRQILFSQGPPWDKNDFYFDPRGDNGPTLGQFFILRGDLMHDFIDILKVPTFDEGYFYQ